MASRCMVLTYDRAAVPLGEVLDRQVEALHAAHRAGDPVAAEVLRGTGAAQGAEAELLRAELTTQTAREAIARDHSYPDWAAAREHAQTTVDTRFEAAADAIHWGELAALRDLLDEHPALVSARSPFPHHCQLLHHVAANGIEVERQLETPPGAPDIMRLLLDRGAEVDAACDTYGGGPGMTTLCLLVSSCVPAAAGLHATLVDVLCDGRAQVNGPRDDGAPLRTAITFGYTEAAEALVRRGARVDNLVCYAGMGDLAGVAGCFGADGELGPARADDAARYGVPEGKLVEYALIQAACHGRRAVVEFLLSKDPDLRYVEPLFGATPRGAAEYGGHPEIAALLAPT